MMPLIAFRIFSISVNRGRKNIRPFIHISFTQFLWTTTTRQTSMMTKVYWMAVIADPTTIRTPFFRLNAHSFIFWSSFTTKLCTTSSKRVYLINRLYTIDLSRMKGWQCESWKGPSMGWMVLLKENLLILGFRIQLSWFQSGCRKMKWWEFQNWPDRACSGYLRQKSVRMYGSCELAWGANSQQQSLTNSLHTQYSLNLSFPFASLLSKLASILLDNALILS